MILFLAEIGRKGHRASAFLDPRQSLRGRIDLIVVLASREGREFVYILGEPGGFFRQRNKSVLNGRGLRVETHDLLGYRKFVNRRSFQRDAQGRVENWI
jgi:hypothetical protein